MRETALSPNPPDGCRLGQSAAGSELAAPVVRSNKAAADRPDFAVGATGPPILFRRTIVRSLLRQPGNRPPSAGGAGAGRAAEARPRHRHLRFDAEAGRAVWTRHGFPAPM